MMSITCSYTCQCAPWEGIGLQQEIVLSGNWVAPAGSSRSGEGGNKLVEAFDATVMHGMISEESGRNVSKR